MALACGLAASVSLVSSCTGHVSPSVKSKQLADSSAVTVYSTNDSSSARSRVCDEAGPIPETAGRALQIWLENSTVKNFSYAYPQYYISLTNPRTGSQSVWGICSDGQGNLVGLLIPRRGVAAWDLPFIGSYKMYVCDTPQRKILSDTIMESLADAGYDKFRLDARRVKGLTQEQYLISKPLTDAEKARLAELKAQEEAAAKAAEEAAKAKVEAEAAASAAESAEADSDASEEEEEDSGDDSSESETEGESAADEDAGADDDDF
ncbi:MAG: hypothetical protein ACI4O9_06545 [Akkermansia sp.]